MEDLNELEPYFTVKQVAQAFQTDEDTVRKWLKDDPTVFRWGRMESTFKRAYINWRIPKSTIERLKRQGGPGFSGMGRIFTANPPASLTKI